MKTAIVGAGAAGLCAAIAAGEKGDTVTLYERMDRVGKKLLATGNGRCNIMNMGPLAYPQGESFARRAFTVFPPQALWDFFQAHGLALREEGQGRVYPATGQAATVLNVLLGALKKTSVEVRTSTAVNRIELKENGYLLENELYDKVIIASGGKAQPKLGSDGSGYTLLAALNHPLVAPTPALTPLETETTFIKGLSGLRIKAEVAIKVDGRLLRKEAGEVLFTDYGVSGVCVMQLSPYYAKGATLHLDMSMAMNANEDLYAFFKRRRIQPASATPEDFLVGLFATPLCASIKKRAALVDLSDETLMRLAKTIKDFTLPIRKPRCFDYAQVTGGGAALSHFNPLTMESTIHRRLYAAGEVLDVTGDCGGFNLMFAFASGIIAAYAA